MAAANTRFEISKQFRTKNSSMHSAHDHFYCEMYYLVDGQCDLSVGDNTYNMTSGMLIFIPKKVMHQTKYPNNCVHTRIYIEFTENYIEELVKQFGKSWLEDYLFNRVMYLSDPYRSSIDSIIENIIEENKKKDSFSGYLTKSYFHELIIRILRYHKDFCGISSSEKKITDASIQHAIYYIMNNYTQKISLNDVSETLHLNPSYFSKKFKSVTNIGFKEYLNNLRINHSEKLLLETNMSITDIAFKCGYDNSNYYGDAFKKKNGVSPTCFRQKKGNI